MTLVQRPFVAKPKTNKFQKVTTTFKEFPEALREIPEPPEQLYLRGDPSLLRWNPKIAVIGARDPTGYGLQLARQIAGDLARAGACIVSGLARGIDGMAHQAALEAGGKTIAVLGTPIDELAPKSNLELGKRIIDSGLVVSEYRPGHEVRPWHFAARNRIISGLSRGVVIVEAAEKSGTLVTARWALDQGREVFAVPGPVDAEKSAGTLQLIRDGARCVRSAQDIFDDLGLSDLPQRRLFPLEATKQQGPEEPLLQYLEAEPVHVDELLEGSGLSPAELSQILLRLELDGAITQLPGQRYVRCAAK